MKLARTCWSIVVLSMVLPANGCGESSDNQKGHAKPLIVHVGEPMQPVMAALAKQYEKETGAKVKIDTANSGELLYYIQTRNKGDVYVCLDPFLQMLMDRKLGVDGWVVARLAPVIVVAKGNPKKIKGVRDLATRKDLAVRLTDYEKSTLGWLLPTIFQKVNVDFDKEVKKAKHIRTSLKGSQVANRVVTGNADAAICWNAVAFLRKDKLDVIDVPPEQRPTPDVDTVTSATRKVYALTPVTVTLATLKCAKQPEAAAKFAAFVAGPAGRKTFGERGFTGCQPRKLYEGGTKVK